MMDLCDWVAFANPESYLKGFECAYDIPSEVDYLNHWGVLNGQYTDAVKVVSYLIKRGVDFSEHTKSIHKWRCVNAPTWVEAYEWKVTCCDVVQDEVATEEDDRALPFSQMLAIAHHI